VQVHGSGRRPEPAEALRDLAPRMIAQEQKGRGTARIRDNNRRRIVTAQQAIRRR
jgi:hypothetical protein